MARTVLAGEYGTVYKTVVGTPITSGTLTANAIYRVVTIGGSTALPSGAVVGGPFYADGTETLASGDSVSLLTKTELCEISAWSMSFTGNEIQIGRLCDDYYRYIYGIVDISGTLDLFWEVGGTASKDFASKVIDVHSQAGAGGAITVTSKNNDTYTLYLVKQASENTGETETGYFIDAQIGSFDDAGAQIGSLQTISVPLRLAADGVKPVLYEITRS